MKHLYVFMRTLVTMSMCLLLTLSLNGCGGKRDNDKGDDESDESNSAQGTSGQSMNTSNEQFTLQGGAVFGFNTGEVGKIPKGWSHDRTGQGAMGNWVVIVDTSAPSQPNVLAQTSQDQTDYRFPVAVIDTSLFTDLQLSVMTKAVKGSIDQGGGIVWRYKDINNYYVLRANALEDNVNLYKVVGGRRKEIQGWKAKVTSNEWHTLGVEMKGSSITCYFDGNKMFEIKDDTFSGPGKIGLWTKADSYILFDDVKVRGLESGK